LFEDSFKPLISDTTHLMIDFSLLIVLKNSRISYTVKEKSIEINEYKKDKIRKNELLIQIQRGLIMQNQVFIYELTFKIEEITFN